MKPFAMEFGEETLRLQLPDHAEILTLPAVEPLKHPATAIRHALQKPIGTPALAEIVRKKVQHNPKAHAVIVVSDSTRPVPYRGEQGILEPLLEVLRAEHVASIEILVATGTHRPMTEAELRQILPPAAFAPGVTVTNHRCTETAELRHIGRTARGTEVWINRRYLDADIKILTGLVEPHFMAGVSGGTKSICPGLVGEQVTYIFHGAAMMADARADSLLLDGNPCREESRAVAGMAGVDFIVNVTIDRNKQVTGVFAGDLDQAHHAATQKALSEVVIPFAQHYDFVVTHSGFVGINHYQAAKAAVEGARAVKVEGTLLLAANLSDAHPVGGVNYRRVLPLLRELGHDAAEQKLLSAGWTFVPEQWELQMWGRVFRRLGPEGKFILCAPQLTGENFHAHGIHGHDGGEGLSGAGRALAEAMVQRVLHRVQPHHRIAILADGPYGVPQHKP
ncbi:MAG: nickel-dependent lactate racemase [Kiritimatiellaeota bacterium]|nr:nickel-dependent lactate racemase [Kiritimatiellota bacterium]